MNRCIKCGSDPGKDAIVCSGGCGTVLCGRCKGFGVTGFVCDECDEDDPRVPPAPDPEDVVLAIVGPALSLASIQLHRECVRGHIQGIVDELSRRSASHDRSKLRRDELSGYLSLNRALQGKQYGSDEYRAAVEEHRDVVTLHQQRNSHHPEFHPSPSEMGFLDVIEMVCDWAGAAEAYTGAPDLASSLRREVDRQRPFSREQRWLILELCDFLQPGAIGTTLRSQFMELS